MQAMTIRAPGGLDNLVLVEKAQPVPGPGEVLVRMRASSLNYHDYVIAIGLMPAADGMVPMSDGAGEVVEVGEGVSEFQSGDKVMSVFHPEWQSGPPVRGFNRLIPGDSCDGFASEYVAVPEAWLTRIPAGWDYCEAATLVCAGLTAWAATLRDGLVGPDSTVLVQGTGGVSIFALQFAKAVGARVIATSSSEAKLERLHELGADDVINYREVPKWGERVRELTGGNGVDLVVEVGGAGTMAQSIEACRVGGHITLVGVLDGISGEVPVFKLFTKQITVVGIAVDSRAGQLAMIEFLESHKIRPVIDSRFALADLAAAFRRQEAGLHFGKICIDI